MQERRRASLRLVTSVVLLTLLALRGAPSATAQTNGGSYVFLLASGLLCDPGDSSMCPAIAKSNQGDSYELSGAGTFDVQSKSVKAAGTFTHKSPNGNVLETGVWLANELVSFDSYGVAPNELLPRNMPSGPAAMISKRMPMARGPMPTGGLGIFRILLLPISGPTRTSELHVNCALGDVPRKRSVEGIRLKLENSNTEYSEEVSGRTMFLAWRPEVGTPAKAQKEETTPEDSEQPHN